MTRLIFSFLVASLLIAPGIASAQSEPTTTTETTETKTKIRDEIKTKREARKKALEIAKTAREEKKLTSSQDLATKLIEERIELLEKLRDGQYTKKCRAAAKAEATTAINAAIERLKSLEVDQTKTVDEVRSLIKDGIIGKNHVYVAILPAIRGMCAADRIIAIVDGKLAELTSQLDAENQDTSALEEQLTKAKTAAQTAYDLYKKAANNPGKGTYKTDLAAAKEKLKEAKTALAAARGELGKLKTSSPDNSSN